MRDAAVKAEPLMMSPRYDGRLRPSSVSVSDERGLANWPAMRPSFTTGTLAPKVSTTLICSSTRKVSRMMSAVNSPKLSAQAPPCSTKARPSDASASCCFSRLASPANTSGG